MELPVRSWLLRCRLGIERRNGAYAPAKPDQLIRETLDHRTEGADHSLISASIRLSAETRLMLGSIGFVRPERTCPFMRCTIRRAPQPLSLAHSNPDLLLF
jgi:hypothetical protein